MASGRLQFDPSPPTKCRGSLAPQLIAQAGVVGGPGAVAWVAFKVGALSYGGGFVIIPLMQHDAVVTYHRDRAIAGSAIPLGLSLQHLWQVAVLAGAALWLFVLRRGVVSGLLLAGAVGVVLALAGAAV